MGIYSSWLTFAPDLAASEAAGCDPDMQRADTACAGLESSLALECLQLVSLEHLRRPNLDHTPTLMKPRIEFVDLEGNLTVMDVGSQQAVGLRAEHDGAGIHDEVHWIDLWTAEGAEDDLAHGLGAEAFQAILGG